MNNNFYREFQILFTGDQKALINAMFSGPELVAELLNKEEKLQLNSNEIKLFLLRNKAILFSFICDYLHDDLDILVEVVYRIATLKKGENKLEFIGGCSISRDNNIYFPVKKLGLVRLADQNLFANWRSKTGNRRYYDNFSIIKRCGDFFVQIPVQPIMPSFKKGKLKISKKGSELIKNVKDINVENTVAQSAGSGKELTPSERKVAGAIATAMRLSSRRTNSENNSGGGSIWTVSGGLPSLGKRN